MAHLPEVAGFPSDEGVIFPYNFGGGPWANWSDFVATGFPFLHYGPGCRADGTYSGLNCANFTSDDGSYTPANEYERVACTNRGPLLCACSGYGTALPADPTPEIVIFGLPLPDGIGEMGNRSSADELCQAGPELPNDYYEGYYTFQGCANVAAIVCYPDDTVLDIPETHGLNASARVVFPYSSPPISFDSWLDFVQSSFFVEFGASMGQGCTDEGEYSGSNCNGFTNPDGYYTLPGGPSLDCGGDSNIITCACGVNRTITPRPTASPSAQPTGSPSALPSASPSAQPTALPSAAPAYQAPSAAPTFSPTPPPNVEFLQDCQTTCVNDGYTGCYDGYVESDTLGAYHIRACTCSNFDPTSYGDVYPNRDHGPQHDPNSAYRLLGSDAACTSCTDVCTPPAHCLRCGEDTRCRDVSEGDSCSCVLAARRTDAPQAYVLAHAGPLCRAGVLAAVGGAHDGLAHAAHHARAERGPGAQRAHGVPGAAYAVADRQSDVRAVVTTTRSASLGTSARPPPRRSAARPRGRARRAGRVATALPGRLCFPKTRPDEPVAHHGPLELARQRVHLGAPVSAEAQAPEHSSL